MGTFLSLLVFAISAVGFAQNNSERLNSNEIRSLTFNEINDLEIEALDNNNMDQLKKLTREHEQKAKLENNNIEISKAFYYRTIFEEPKIALLYSDSIIQVTKNSKHSRYPTLGYLLKGHIYFNSSNFHDALNNYLLAYKLALEKENTEQEVTPKMIKGHANSRHPKI